MNNFTRRRVFSDAEDNSAIVGSPVTDITYATLSTAITNNTAIEGFYLITDATSTRLAGGKADKGILVQVYKDSLGATYVRLEAEGIFLNPDYQDVGVYSGVVGLTGIAKGTNRGVWFTAETGFINGDITFWNGLHYQVTTAASLNGTDPATNTIAYTVLPKATANMGYIAESDFIEYDFANDWIQRRADKRNNDISLSRQSDSDWMVLGEPACTYFQWGRDQCYGNSTKEALIHSYNALGFHRGNKLDYGSWIGYPGLENSVAATKEISYNTLGVKCYIEQCTCTQDVVDNVLESESNIDNNTVSSTITRNTLTDESTIRGNTLNGPILNNNLSLAAIQNSTINVAGSINGCTFSSMNWNGKTVSSTQVTKRADRMGSDFEETVVITGLTTLDLTATDSLIGRNILSSTNATESINLFSNFPDYIPVRFYPETGLTVTFVHNTGANQPRCGGAVNVILNGTNGDWVEFTKNDAGVIYQTGGETY